MSMYSEQKSIQNVIWNVLMITFIPPKPKIAKLNKVVNPIDPNEVPNAGTLVDRGTPNEGVGNFNTISSGMI